MTNDSLETGALPLDFMPADLPPPVTPAVRKCLILSAGLISLLLAFSPGAEGASSLQDSPNGPGEQAVAFVNGFPIYPSDMRCAMEASLARKPHFPTEPSPEGSRVLENLINIELLYQESLKHRYPGLVEESGRIFEKEVKEAGGRRKLEAALECNGISLDRFQRAIFRNVSIRKLLDDRVYSRITVTEEEIQDYYSENLVHFRSPGSVRIRQILIRTPSSSDEKALKEAEERAKNVFLQATKGRDFLSLARKYSDDPDGAGSVVEMGVLFKGNLHKPFESILSGLNEGDVTQPLRSSSGFHIFQLVSLSQPSNPPLEEVRQTISRRIHLAKAKDMVTDFIASIRTNATIVIVDGERE